jgi:hypothetical protein
MFVLQEGRTALIWASINGHTEAVKALIEKGADVDAKDKVRRRYCVGTGVGTNDQRLEEKIFRNIEIQGTKFEGTFVDSQ